MNKEHKLSFFSIFLLLFVVVNVLAVILGLVVLWRGLEDYEHSLPVYAVQTIAEDFENNRYETIIALSGYEPKPFASTALLGEYLQKKTAGKELTYQKTKSENPNEERYLFKAGEEKLAVAVLEKRAEKTAFGFDLWQISKIESLHGTVKTFHLTANSGAILQVNGEVVTKDNAKAEEQPYAVYEGLPPAFTIPTQTTYTLTNLLDTPVVTGAGITGEACTVLTNPGQPDKMEIVTTPDMTIQQEMTATAVGAAQAYARFIAKDAVFADLAPYLVYGSSFYKSMQSFDNRWYIAHDSYKIEQMQTQDFIFYDENYASCDISFDYIVTMGRKTFTYPSSYTAYLVKDQGRWFMANMVVN